MKNILIIGCKKCLDNFCIGCGKCMAHDPTFMNMAPRPENTNISLISCGDCNGCKIPEKVESFLKRTSVEEYKEIQIKLASCVKELCPFSDDIITTLENNFPYEILKTEEEYRVQKILA
jgi:predicted metal-binding protein